MHSGSELFLCKRATLDDLMTTMRKNNHKRMRVDKPQNLLATTSTSTSTTPMSTWINVKQAATQENQTSSLLHLFDLPDQFLIEIGRYLDCRSLLRFQCAHRNARAIVEEVVVTTSSFACALSTASSLSTALAEVRKSALSRITSSPSFAFLFVSPSYALDSLSQGLDELSSRLPPNMRLLGCHGVGIIGRDETGAIREVEGGANAISLALIHLPQTTVSTHFLANNVLEKHLRSPSPSSSVHDPSTPNHPTPISTSPKDSVDSSLHWLCESLELSPLTSKSLFPSYVLFSSPITLVTSFLRSLYSITPNAVITGAIASGGRLRPPQIALFTKASDQPIQLHHNGIAILSILPSCPIPKMTDSEATSPISEESSYTMPPLTAFASRGCKPISPIYQITRSHDDLLYEINDVSSHDATLGGTDSHSNTFDESIQNEEELSSEAIVPHGAPQSAIQALWNTLEKSHNFSGNVVTGLFVGISENRIEHGGRVICDILNVFSDGMRIDVAAFLAVNSTDDVSISSCNLTGKYIQFYELNDQACISDLSRRVQPFVHVPYHNREFSDKRKSSPTAKRNANSINCNTQLVKSEVDPHIALNPKSEQLAKNPLYGAYYSLHSDRSPALQDYHPIGSLVFTCAGRGEAFFNEAHVDSNIVSKETSLNVCGFFCNGEIGPPARSLNTDELSHPQLSWSMSSPTFNHPNANDFSPSSCSNWISQFQSEGLLPPNRSTATAVGRNRGVLQSFTAVVSMFYSSW